MSTLNVRAGVRLVRRVRPKRKMSAQKAHRNYVRRTRVCPHCLGHNVKGPYGIKTDILSCRNCDWHWGLLSVENSHTCTWEDPKEDRHYHYRPDLSEPCLRAVDRVSISFGPYM